MSHQSAHHSVTLVAIGTGAVAILICIAFSISWYASRQRQRELQQPGQILSRTALSRADSTMSKQTELFGSPMPPQTPTPYSEHAMTPSTGSTLVGTPNLAYVLPAMRKEGYGHGHGMGAGMGGDDKGKGGTFRSPFTRQLSDNGPSQSSRERERDKRYSATTDGRGSVVVITYEEGLAEMGRRGLVSPSRTAAAKVESSRRPSLEMRIAAPALPSARPTVTSYNQPSGTFQTAHAGTVPGSPTFGALTAPTASPASALPSLASASRSAGGSNTNSPLRPSRPSVSRRTRSKAASTPRSIGMSDMESGNTTESETQAQTSEYDSPHRRDARGRDGLDRAHGFMVPDSDWEEDQREHRMTYDGPQSAFLPSYYQPAGERRKTRTRGGQI